MESEGFLRDLPKALADIDEWQTEMQLKPMRVGRVQLYTDGLPHEDRSLTGVEVVSDLDAADPRRSRRRRRGGGGFHPRRAIRDPQYVAV